MIMVMIVAVMMMMTMRMMIILPAIILSLPPDDHYHVNIEHVDNNRNHKYGAKYKKYYVIRVG